MKMANANLFQSLKGKLLPNTDTVSFENAPYGTTQAAERDDVLNVGGFSDDVFNIIAAFAAGQLGAAHWVGEIQSVVI